MQSLQMTTGPSQISDDEWFAEIELSERSKRRVSPETNVGGSSLISSLYSLFRDLHDGFSLPKGAYIKYAN
jgi:hypothetical protein